MSITEKCPHCGAAFPAAERDVTERATCTQCGRPLVVGTGHPDASRIVKQASREAQQERHEQQPGS
jgi:DNA-directed RNA polymerase subunit RPC12/RpoP